MLKEFLELNKSKIIFGLKWIPIVLTAIVFIIFAVVGKLPPLSLFLKILTFTVIVFPLFVMLLGTFMDYLKFKRINEVLNSYPYNELTKNGFKRVPTNQKTKFFFSQIMLQGYFDDYPMDCEVEDGTLKIIALVNQHNFKKEHLRELKKKFGNDKIEQEWTGISLKYVVKRARSVSYEQLNDDLESFVQFFKNEGLKPWDQPWE